MKDSCDEGNILELNKSKINNPGTSFSVPLTLKFQYTQRNRAATSFVTKKNDSCMSLRKITSSENSEF